ncbi:MAG: hypothetical protein NZ571_14045 [Anaerolineae bacterium]|nr:hypothetical protein [Anaerolineae bacterium]
MRYQEIELTDYTRSLLDRLKRCSDPDRGGTSSAPLPKRAVRNARRRAKRREAAWAKAVVKGYYPIEPTPYTEELLAKFKKR